jgi:hypothetical protein
VYFSCIEFDSRSLLSQVVGADLSSTRNHGHSSPEAIGPKTQHQNHRSKNVPALAPSSLSQIQRSNLLFSRTKHQLIYPLSPSFLPFSSNRKQRVATKTSSSYLHIRVSDGRQSLHESGYNRPSSHEPISWRYSSIILTQKTTEARARSQQDSISHPAKNRHVDVSGYFYIASGGTLSPSLIN